MLTELADSFVVYHELVEKEQEKEVEAEEDEKTCPYYFVCLDAEEVIVCLYEFDCED